MINNGKKPLALLLTLALLLGLLPAMTPGAAALTTTVNFEDVTQNTETAMAAHGGLAFAAYGENGQALSQSVTYLMSAEQI